jgi:hypothetical protein
MQSLDKSCGKWNQQKKNLGKNAFEGDNWSAVSLPKARL